MPKVFLLFLLCFSLACGSTDGGAAPCDDLEAPPEALGFQINENEFVVESGGDVQYCERFALPERFAGRDVYLIGVEAYLPPGTHHFFMGHTTKADLSTS